MLDATLDSTSGRISVDRCKIIWNTCARITFSRLYPRRQNFSYPLVVASNGGCAWVHFDSRSSTSHYNSSAHTFLPPVLLAGCAINESVLLRWCTSEGFALTAYGIDDPPAAVEVFLPVYQIPGSPYNFSTISTRILFITIL